MAKYWVAFLLQKIINYCPPNLLEEIHNWMTGSSVHHVHQHDDLLEEIHNWMRSADFRSRNFSTLSLHMDGFSVKLKRTHKFSHAHPTEKKKKDRLLILQGRVTYQKVEDR